MSAIKSWYTCAGLAALLATGASCTLIYDADVFNTTDAAPPDALVPDAVVPDADPNELSFQALEPAEVFEGEGCIPVDTGCRSDSRRVGIVIRGARITPEAELRLTGAGYENALVDLTVGPDGAMAAFELSVPVLPELADGMTQGIEVELSQAGVVRTRTLTVRGLDELLASSAGAAIDVGTLRARYSRIDIDTPVVITGNRRVQLLATAEIVVGAALDVSGRNASGQTAGSPGPGGCRGAGPESPAMCEGGGGGGTDGAAGGGGGHAEQGEPGEGASTGNGGAATGRIELSPLEPQFNEDTARGHGGGGGSNCVGGQGGAGGGGGGSLELTSKGSLRFTAAARLLAQGGVGGNSSGLCTLSQRGDGGGGSGGAILVRAGMAFADEGAADSVNAAGGAGGTGGNAGGDGAPGRVRLDQPGVDPAPSFQGVTHFYRGPMWSPDSPAIVAGPIPSLRLSGGANNGVFLEVGGRGKEGRSFSPEGMLDFTPALEPGHNAVCAVVTIDSHSSQPDAFNCIDIVYIPVPPPP
jgi:hypothetical protein